MKRYYTILLAVLFISPFAKAQTEPNAGTWKTWFISSGKDHRLPAPADQKKEIAAVLTAQKELDAAGLQQINFWNAGSPGYHWQRLVGATWMNDLSYEGFVGFMLLGAATYDATIAAWDTKYAHKTLRPFAVDKRIKLVGLNPGSPSYPCEHSIAAGVAVTVIAKFFPKMADSANRMAQRAMASRIAAGLAFPSDTRAGYELGKKIAEKEIEHVKDFAPTATWDGKMPEGKQYYSGKFAMMPLGGQLKTVVLSSASQFRPAPPPDFAKDMEELKNFKQNFGSQSNAFLYASQSPVDNLIDTKIFEQNWHLNPPRAARIYAAKCIGMYDAFAACWDAKYAYWGIRPIQYDTTFKSLLPTPPFPGYPSGHATMGGMAAELYTYFFPSDKAAFDKISKDGAESRFQGGIHFRTDNEVGIIIGRKVAQAVVQRLKQDGADESPAYADKKQ